MKGKNLMIGTKEKEQLIETLSSHSKERKNLIPLLQEIQAKLGYLPKEVMQEIANFLGIPEVEVYGVATFYNQFRFLPLGKHYIRVCLGTACHLAGGKLILEALERELGIKVGETSEDGEFSLERVACVGCCMLAPVMIAVDNIYPKMTPFKVEEALIPYKQESKKESSNEGKLGNTSKA